MKEIAPLLRRRQFRRLGNIRKGSSKTWSNLCQFGRVVPHPPTVVIETRRLRETAFKNLDEGKEGKRLVSFVARSHRASETDAQRVLPHLHRQTGFAHAPPPPN